MQRVFSLKNDRTYPMQDLDNSYPRQIVPRTIVPKRPRTQVNSYPEQLAQKGTRTQDNSYPSQLVHRPPCAQDNSYSGNSYPRQLVLMTTRTQDNCYPEHVESKTTDTLIRSVTRTGPDIITQTHTYLFYNYILWYKLLLVSNVLCVFSLSVC